LMIALLVLTLMIGAYVGANCAAQRTSEEMHERTVAIQDANRVIEQIRNLSNTEGLTFPSGTVTVYPDGGTVTNASVVVTANYQLLSLKGEGLGIYSARFVPEVSEEELVEIRVEAKDAAGNSGQKRLNLKPSGYWMHVVKENAVFYFFPLLFIFYILLLTVKEIRFFLGRTGLRGKKQQLLLLKKKLQEDFYAKNVVSKQTYDLRNAELNTELNEVRAKLDLIEQKGG